MKSISSLKTSKNKKGFTLIELLIVIAVIGVLATVILVAINPLQQFARGRDAGRKSTSDQLDNALEAYYTSHSAAWPTANATWIGSLVSSGEVSIVPAAPTYSAGASACATNVQPANGWCYQQGVTGTTTTAAIYIKLESNSEQSKCTPAPSGSLDSGTVAYFMWSSADAKSGVVCLNIEPNSTQMNSNAAGAGQTAASSFAPYSQ